MIIGADLDDTWFGWSIQLDERLDERFPHLTGIPRSVARTRFDLWDGRTDEERTAILSIMDEPGFYQTLRPLPGAVDAYWDMVAEGHEVVPISSPWYTNATCMDDKGRSILEHFGADALDNLVLTKKKYRVNVDVLIDDKPDILNTDIAPWAHVLFDGPHNRYSDAVRLTNWADWRTAVNQALLRKANSTYGHSADLVSGQAFTAS